MTTAGDTQSPWRWTFHSAEQLRRALEEYTEFQDNALVSRYGNMGGGDGDGKKQWRIMRQNAEIDRRMAVLEVWAPKVHKLLDLYFRRGLCAEADGWTIAAARVGLACDKDNPFCRELFEAQCAWCVDVLLHTHHGHYERTLDTTSGQC